MRILLYSPVFHPSVGGLEMVMSILAHEFVSAGHDVKIVSSTFDPEGTRFPFEVIRKPSARILLGLVRWCEVFFMGNISLRGMWPLLLVPRTVVATHQGWYCRTNDKTGWQDRLKLFVSRFITNVASSQAVADHLPGKSVVIHNPYRDDLFHRMNGTARDRDIVFLGRLVSQKGVDILISALEHLRDSGLSPSATIIGEGPERETLRRRCLLKGLDRQVHFVGARRGAELAALLNRHKIMAIPSRVKEGFGIVALEGIACGCYILGSDRGGVPEAVGPCGETYNADDDLALGKKLKEILLEERWRMVDDGLRTEHLLSHGMKSTARKYLSLIERAYGGAGWS